MNIGSYCVFQPENVESFKEQLIRECNHFMEQLEAVASHQCEQYNHPSHTAIKEFINDEYTRQVNDARQKCLNIIKRIDAVEADKQLPSSPVSCPSSPIGLISPQSSVYDELFCDEDIESIFVDLDSPKENIASRKLCYCSQDNDAKRQKIV